MCIEPNPYRLFNVEIPIYFTPKAGDPIDSKGMDFTILQTLTNSVLESLASV